jgi:hypothetical protein
MNREETETMLDLAKTGLKKLIPSEILKLQRDRKALKVWESQGKPAPPPHVIKENTIKEYARNFNTRTLIETGTYKGDMVQAMKKHFDRVVSFELDPLLHEEARKRFAADQNVSIVLGDSGQILGEHLASITEPCLFWLDGHYSGGITAKADLNTPIKNELHQILNHNVSGHVILVDDARCFNGEDDYPILQQLKDFILNIKPEWEFSVHDDIIRVHQKR